MFYQYQHFGISEYFCKEYGENFSFPNHLHQSFELIMVLSGNMTVTVDNEKYTVSQNEAVLVFPNQLHSLESAECEHMLVIFSPDIVRAYYTKKTDKVTKNSKFTIPPYLAAQIETIEGTSSKIKMKAVLYNVCSIFDEATEYLDKKSGEAELLYKIFEYVEKCYATECTLASLSRELGFSYFYLSRYFSGAVGMSFNTYINRYRISKACYLLANTNLPVLECAYEVGYKSLRSFNRNFKIYTGMTPNQYRTKTV
jgi:AraC-like DNA-binding protein